MFKDWVEKNYQNNELTLSDSVLVNPKKHSVKVVTSHPIQENAPSELAEILPKEDEEDGWETFMSKKTKRMINMVMALEAIRRDNASSSQNIPERPLPYRGQFLYSRPYRKADRSTCTIKHLNIS